MANAKTDLLSVPVATDGTALPCTTGFGGTDDIPIVYVQQLRTLFRYLSSLSDRPLAVHSDLFLGSNVSTPKEYATLAGHLLEPPCGKTCATYPGPPPHLPDTWSTHAGLQSHGQRTAKPQMPDAKRHNPLFYITKQLSKSSKLFERA